MSHLPLVRSAFSLLGRCCLRQSSSSTPRISMEKILSFKIVKKCFIEGNPQFGTLLYSHYQRLRSTASISHFWLASVILCLISIAALPACNNKPTENKLIGNLTFALPVADWWTASPFLVTQSATSFRENRIEISTLEVNSGLASKNAVVAGTADIGLSAATPLALAAARGEKIVILGTYLNSSKVIGIIRPSGTSAGARPPEPVAVVPSTISESYMYQYLDRFGIKGPDVWKQVQKLDQRPADIPGAVRNGAAKSAVVWEPFLSMSGQVPGFVVEHPLPDFQVNLYLITRPSVLENKRAEVMAFLEGVKASCRYLKENSDEARLQIEKHFGFSNNFLAQTWMGVSYGVVYDQARMKAELEREAGVAKALGYISEMPNVDYMFVDLTANTASPR